MPETPPNAAITIVPPDTSTIVTKQSSLAERVAAIVVRDKASAEQAAEVRNGAKQLLKGIDEMFDPQIAQAHKLHKDLLATKKKFTDPVNLQIINPVNAKLSAYNAEVEKARLAEQAKQQEQARIDEENRRIEEAGILHSMGDVAGAEATLEEAIAAPAPIVEVKKEKIAGVSFVTQWKWEFLDLTQVKSDFLSAEIDSATGRRTVVSTTGITAMVNACKNAERATKAVGGIKVWSVDVPR